MSFLGSPLGFEPRLRTEAGLADLRLVASTLCTWSLTSEGVFAAVQHMDWPVVEATDALVLTEEKYEHERSLDADGRFHCHMSVDLFYFLGEWAGTS